MAWAIVLKWWWQQKKGHLILYIVKALYRIGTVKKASNQSVRQLCRTHSLYVQCYHGNLQEEAAAGKPSAASCNFTVGRQRAILQLLTKQIR